MPRQRQKLRDFVETLLAHYGPPAPPVSTDPFELILFENCAYLVDDDRRLSVWNALRRQIGTRPQAIRDAPTGVLVECIRNGGMQPERRAEKLQAAARTVLDECDGDLNADLAGPTDRARRILKKFPGIGDPGADKLMLFCGRQTVLALDSNGLRVLLRLGFGKESDNYAASYKSVQAALASELPDDIDWLIAAHQLLRQHGQKLCRRTRPLCTQCPLRSGCPSAVMS